MSDHEVAQGYETVVDPSVFVRFPVAEGPLAEQGAALLIWTTTPWTLVSNTAVAVHPDVTYVLAGPATGNYFVVADPLVEAVLGEGVQRLDTMTGRELVGTRYRAPFELVDIAGGTHDDNVHTVLPATYVTVSDGTGIGPPCACLRS